MHQPDPEPVQPRARAFTAALGETGSEQQRVDRAGTGAANGVDRDGWLFEETLQHAPREGGEGAAALKGQ